MTSIARMTIVGFLLIASSSAMASTLEGLATLVIGLPAFTLFNILFGVLLLLKPSRTRKIIATVTLLPMLAVGVLLWHDASSRWNHPSDHWIAGWYFGLVALSVLLYGVLISRRSKPSVD